MERAAAAGPPKLGWTNAPVKLPDTHLDDVDSTRAGTWAVGVTLLEGFHDTRPLVVRWQSGRWVATPTPIHIHSRLHSVAVAGANEVWAVGVELADPQLQKPLVLRWNGRAWRVVRPPSVRTGGFAEVVVAPDGSVWVAGWAEVDGAEHGVVYRYARGRWHSLSAGLEQTMNGNALLVESATDAWLAPNPGLAHFDGKAWTSVDEVPSDGSQILTRLVSAGPADIWAVGLAHGGGPGQVRPLAIHYDGTSWSSVPTPAETGQLHDMALWHGRPVAVGNQFIRQGQVLLERPYVLEHRRGEFVRAAAPTLPAAATGVLSGVVAARSRLWTVGSVDQAAFAAYVD
jgi:hypothetical protein